MKKIYLLSDIFDYSKMIAPDAGPKYSENMLWQYDYIKNIGKYSDCINIIDTRITPPECAWLEDYMSSRKNTFFLLTVTDPIWEYCQNHWYYKFLFQVKNLENVLFLSKYIPSEIVEELDRQTGYKKMVFIPYAFADKHKISKNFADRYHRIIISGALEVGLYPYRSKFYKSAVSINPFNFVIRRNTLILHHPDYPDIDRALTHNIIGDKYIEYLSQFSLMLVTPSRCHLELLKYSECAYAKCAPIGKVPKSFSKDMKEPFLEVDFCEISRSVKKILSISLDEISDRANQYYQAFEKERNPIILNSNLDSFLNFAIKFSI